MMNGQLSVLFPGPIADLYRKHGCFPVDGYLVPVHQWGGKQCCALGIVALDSSPIGQITDVHSAKNILVSRLQISDDQLMDYEEGFDGGLVSGVRYRSSTYSQPAFYELGRLTGLYCRDQFGLR